MRRMIGGSRTAGPGSAWRTPAARALARTLACALLVALPSLVAGRAAGAQEAPHRRFLLVYSQDGALPANVRATEGVVAAFSRALGGDYEIYVEYRDDQRFPGAEEDRRFFEQLERRYRDQRFDAILAFGGWALEHMVAQRTALGLDAPVVFGGVGSGAFDAAALPADVHGVTSGYSIPGTIALARRLQPAARRVVVMTGSQAFDRSWEARARRELAGLDGMGVDFVSGLTLAGFQEVAAGLDRDTILLILTIYTDAAGLHFTPANAAQLIAGRSGAPAWSVYDTSIGRGVVGGEVQRFRDVGTAMAEQALALAEGGVAVAPMREVPAQPVLDWRQMQRFGLDRRLLPANADLEFYEPTAWERYRPQIVLAVAVILLQSGTITALVVQERRRRKIEREVTARRSELAHVSRVAQLGELSGGMAHELNQPLTSILANAEAGAQLVGREPLDRDEIAAIFADIAEDDRRAAAIIADLRRLMTRGEVVFDLLDLNGLVEGAIRLVQSELLLREVRVDLSLARDALPVRANRAQIKQVLLNLTLNAADAMAAQPAATRVVTIASRLRADGWRELSVRDAGPGLDPAIAGDPFQPFVTTKPTGLGLGLSICRTIVQSHGGTLAFDAAATGGARAVLALPPP